MTKGKRIIVPVFLILSIFFLRYDFVDAQASSTDSIANQMQQITDTKTQLEKQIADDEEQLKNLSTQSSSLSNAIKTLNAKYLACLLVELRKIINGKIFHIK